MNSSYMNEPQRIISAKLNTNYPEQEMILAFLDICAENGVQKAFLLRLALKRFIDDVESGYLSCDLFSPELLELLGFHNTTPFDLE